MYIDIIGASLSSAEAATVLYLETFRQTTTPACPCRLGSTLVFVVLQCEKADSSDWNL